MVNPQGKIPAFFTVYFPAFSAKSMQIPLAFTKHMSGRLPEKAFLRDRFSNRWPVHVAGAGDELYFQEGWEEFLKDNGVKEREFLVFQFDGDCVFDFKLYQGNCFEREVNEGYHFKIKVEDEEVEEIQEEVEKEEEKDKLGKRKVNEKKSKPKDNTSGVGLTKFSSRAKFNEGHDLKTKVEDEELEQNQEKVAKEVDEEDEEEIDMEDDDSNDSDYDYEMEEKDMLETQKVNEKASNPKEKTSGVGLTKFSTDTESGCKRKSSVKQKRDHPLKIDDDEESDDDLGVFKSGLIPRPKNPYFVTRIRRVRRSELYVPVDVIRDHNLKLQQEIPIHDEEGRTWNAKIIQWSDGRIWITKGWRAFCKWNHLRKHDICICEFQQGSSAKDISLQVRIVPDE